MLPSSAQAYQALSDYQKTRKNSQQLMDQANQKYDVSGIGSRVSRMRGLVGNLESAVEAVDPSVTARSQGGLTTEAQRSALVNREQAPILQNLGKQQQAFGQAQGDWTMANQLSGDYARNLMAEDQNKYTQLTDMYGKSVAAEQAAEERRRWEAQQAMAREAAAAEERRFQAQLAESRAARAAAASTLGYNLGGMGSGGGGSAPAPTAAPQANNAAVRQQAFNELQNMFKSGRKPQDIYNEMQAITKSAGYGNLKDKYKLELIAQGAGGGSGMGSISANALGNGGSLRF